MAFNGKYINSQEVIRQVFRDNKYKYELPWQDAIEWIADSIDLIGAPMALQPKQVCIKIENYRGMLPCDLMEVTQVAGSFNGCNPFPMRSTTNTFHPVFTCETFQINQELLAEAEISQQSIELPIGQDYSGNPVYEIDNENIIFPGSTTSSSGRSLLNDATYKLNDSFIFTNYKDGYVFIAYSAMPVDEDGFPLIPDNKRYIEAVKCFIRWKVDYILWRSDELNEKVYRDSEREWLWYVASAGNSIRMPNADGMQSLLQQIKLIPTKYAHDNFFNTLGSK